MFQLLRPTCNTAVIFTNNHPRLPRREPFLGLTMPTWFFAVGNCFMSSRWPVLQCIRLELTRHQDGLSPNVIEAASERQGLHSVVVA